jgi:hypothetical protein
MRIQRTHVHRPGGGDVVEAAAVSRGAQARSASSVVRKIDKVFISTEGKYDDFNNSSYFRPNLDQYQAGKYKNFIYTLRPSGCLQVSQVETT